MFHRHFILNMTARLRNLFLLHDSQCQCLYQVRNLGFTSDSSFSLISHMQSISRLCRMSFTTKYLLRPSTSYPCHPKAKWAGSLSCLPPPWRLESLNTYFSASLAVNESLLGWQNLRKFWQDTVFLTEGTKFLPLFLDTLQLLWLNTDFMPRAEAITLQPWGKSHWNRLMWSFLNNYSNGHSSLSPLILLRKAHSFLLV